MMTDPIYTSLIGFKEDFESVARYLLMNYSYENMRRWRRYVVICIASYIVIYCTVYTIDSWSMIGYAIQFLSCHLIADEIENRNGPIKRFLEHRYDEAYAAMTTKRYEKLEDLTVFEDYEPKKSAQPMRRETKILDEDEDYVFCEIKIKKD
jgi:hypothetical protein